MTKPDMYAKYLQACIHAMEKLKQGASIEETKKKLIYYGVKAVNARPEDDYLTFKQVNERMALDGMILSAIASVTPKEFLAIFPLNKTYDGKRWETKDYFTSMEMIREHGIDKPIENAMAFLWDYMNWETSAFLINVTGTFDHMRALDGKPSMMFEFLEEQGVKPLTKYTDHKGKEFIVDSNGKSMKITKKRPRHLRVVN